MNIIGGTRVQASSLSFVIGISLVPVCWPMNTIGGTRVQASSLSFVIGISLVPACWPMNINQSIIKVF
jgi:hypothetical protein